jgi:hypothetical protein
VSELLDEFGRPIVPQFMDENALAFALCIPGLRQEIYESLKKTQEFYEAMTGVTLYDGDGQKVNLSKPMKVSGKAFRLPIQVKP